MSSPPRLRLLLRPRRESRRKRLRLPRKPRLKWMNRLRKQRRQTPIERLLSSFKIKLGPTGKELKESSRLKTRKLKG